MVFSIPRRLLDALRPCSTMFDRVGFLEDLDEQELGGNVTWTPPPDLTQAARAGGRVRGGIARFARLLYITPRSHCLWPIPKHQLRGVKRTGVQFASAFSIKQTGRNQSN